MDIENSVVEELNQKTDTIDTINSFIDSLDLEHNEAFIQLVALLNLPDQQFETIAPAMLSGVEQSMNSPHMRIAMSDVFQNTGIKIENLEDFLLELVEQITLSDKLNITEIKKSFLINLVAIVCNAFESNENIIKRVVKIPIEKCHEEAKAPTYAHITDSGMDVYALEDITINPGETKLVPIGIKVAIPNGYELQVRPKSGRSLKTKLRIANTPGTIDAGYRDEIGIIVENIEPKIADISYGFNAKGETVIKSIEHGKSYTIGKGEKFAQLVLTEIPKVSWYKVDSVLELGEDRGGGFGSTGLK